MKKAQGEEKFVLLLGAGASLASGVLPTASIITELLELYGTGIEGTDIWQRFDQLWKRTPNSTRRGFLSPYLKVPPSPGYEKLANLIRAGYFDVCLTFNYDDLLETALGDCGFDDFKRIIRGETVQEEMQKLVDAKQPRFKLVKLHGSLESADYFLFDISEMHKYPAPIEALVKHLTGRDIIICGYGFNDLCVMSAFAERGGSIVCVNPSGVPRNLSAFLKDRRSEDSEIRTDFDTFFAALHRELLEARSSTAEKPPPNPFKFLESYDETDKDSFRGRDLEIDDFFKFLQWKPAPRVIVITGPSKAGKTSLVRAGLLARLDPDAYLGLYVRCRAEIETHVTSDPALVGLVPADVNLPSALAHLGRSSPDRRVILFLDQFERVTSRFDLRSGTGKRELSEFLGAQLFAGSNDNLTLVLIVSDDNILGATLTQACGRHQLIAGTLVCPTFSRDDVVEIIQSLATNAGFEFDARIIEELADNFEQTKSAPTSGKRFTLAHVHAVCHILAGSRRVEYEGYKRAFDRQNLETLHQVINVSEFTSFAEDFDWPSSAWFRNMIKVPLKESKERIAEFIKAHYQELLPPGDPPSRRRPSQAGTRRTNP